MRAREQNQSSTDGLSFLPESLFSALQVLVCVMLHTIGNCFLAVCLFFLFTALTSTIREMEKLPSINFGRGVATKPSTQHSPRENETMAPSQSADLLTHHPAPISKTQQPLHHNECPNPIPVPIPVPFRICQSLCIVMSGVPLSPGVRLDENTRVPRAVFQAAEVLIPAAK